MHAKTKRSWATWRMFSLWLAVAALLAWGMPSAGQEPESEASETVGQEASADAMRQFREWSARVMPLFQAEKYAEARDVLRQMVEWRPDSVSSWYNLACAQARLNETADAIYSLNMSIDKGWADFRHMEKVWG